jgi:hypothetical protein
MEKQYNNERYEQPTDTQKKNEGEVNWESLKARYWKNATARTIVSKNKYKR